MHQQRLIDYVSRLHRPCLLHSRVLCVSKRTENLHSLIVCRPQRLFVGPTVHVRVHRISYSVSSSSFSTFGPANRITTLNDPANMAADDGKGYALLCLENPLLDIQARCEHSVLEKYDLKANDAILAEEKHMPIYEELSGSEHHLIAGGAAQNSARGAQYMLPASSVVFLGCVGKDKYGALLSKVCADAGVKAEYLQDETHPTGRCAVVITGFNRSLVTNLGAANEYKVEHLKSPRIWSLVQKAKVIYVGGFHLTVCPPAIMALAEHAAAANKPFILNLSAPFIAQFFKDALDATAPYWDVLIGNETEARAFAESHGWDEREDVVEIAKRLAKLPKKNVQRKRQVIITQGTEPTVLAVAQGDDVLIKQFPIKLIDKKDIYDTNGAGDAFAGGLLAGIVEGKPLETCIDMGQWLARLSIKEVGATFPSPKQTYIASA